MAQSTPPLYLLTGHKLMEAVVMNLPDVIDFGLPGLQVTSAQFVGVRCVGSGIVLEVPKPLNHHGVSNVIKGIIGARKASQEKDVNVDFQGGKSDPISEFMKQDHPSKLAGDMKRSKRASSPKVDKYHIKYHESRGRREDVGDHRSTSQGNGRDIELSTWELLWKEGKASGPLKRLKFVTTASGYQLIQSKVDAWASAAHTSMAMNEAAKVALDACGGHLKENRMPRQDSHADSLAPVKHNDGDVGDHNNQQTIDSIFERESEGDMLLEENDLQVQHVIDMKSIQLQGKIHPRCDSKSSILNDGYIMALAGVLPVRFRSYNWTLLYSTSRDGISLNTLYRKVHMNGPTVLVIRDWNKKVFGCFASEEWRVAGRNYGNGECFVFQIVPDMKAYKWTRTNKMFMVSNSEMIAMGGGDHYSILLNSDLLSGYSGPCETFGSPSLSSSEEFEVSSVEVWGFQ